MGDNVVNVSHILCEQVQLWKLYKQVKKIGLHTIYALNIFKANEKGLSPKKKKDPTYL